MRASSTVAKHGSWAWTMLLGFMLLMLVPVSAILIYCARPIDPFHLVADCRGIDFVMRMNEIDCLKMGVNPFYVWHGDVTHELYYPFDRGETCTLSRNMPVNAYTPWEYTFLYPLTMFRSWNFRWAFYTGLKLLALLATVLLLLFRVVQLSVLERCLCLMGFYLVSGAWYTDIFAGNFSVFITFAVLGMALCLNRGYDVLAGFLWAFVLVKPQLGLLLAVPLLIGRRFKAIAVAMLVCLVSSIPPALMCGDSPITLILQAPAAGTGGFTGCALMPLSVYKWLCSDVGFSSGSVLAGTCAVGALLCFVACWLLRRDDSWLVRFSPCVVIAMGWTYVQEHSYSLMVLPIFVLTVSLLRSGSWKWMLFCAVAAILFSDVIQFLVRALFKVMNLLAVPTEGESVTLDHGVRQLSSSLSVLACLVWCGVVGRSSRHETDAGAAPMPEPHFGCKQS